MTRPLRSDPGSYLARPVENLAVRQGLHAILFLIELSGDAPFSLDPRQSHPSGTSDSLDWWAHVAGYGRGPIDGPPLSQASESLDVFAHT